MFSKRSKFKRDQKYPISFDDIVVSIVDERCLNLVGGWMRGVIIIIIIILQSNWRILKCLFFHLWCWLESSTYIVRIASPSTHEPVLY